jgi:hypothetical protein
VPGNACILRLQKIPVGFLGIRDTFEKKIGPRVDQGAHGDIQANCETRPDYETICI